MALQLPVSDTSRPPVRPLAVTADPSLRQAVLRLAESCSVGVDVSADPGVARSSWHTSPLILVGADLAERLAGESLTRRDGVLLLTRDRLGASDQAPWRHAVALSAVAVLALPEQEAVLADRLMAAAGTAATARTMRVCVLGGRGGAGASTMATALALVAHREGARTLLVDADPFGGGLDLMLGGESVPGARWADLERDAATGGIDPDGLLERLPRPGGLPLVSVDRPGPSRPTRRAMGALLTAAARVGDLIVVDLPRRLDEPTVTALVGATALLVVPAELRATAAARGLAAEIRRVAADVRVVVRGPAPAGLRAEDVANGVGLELAGELQPEPGIAARLERGRPPLSSWRGPLAGFCRSYLTGLGVPVAPDGMASAGVDQRTRGRNGEVGRARRRSGRGVVR